MAREDTRKLILDNGAKLVHAKGFVNTGIQEILDAASVPKGSFYFYFKSKEDFGRALVEHYAAFVSAMFDRYLKDASLPPLERLRRFFRGTTKFYKNTGFFSGCPIGNMSQEMSDLSEPIRQKLHEAYSQMKAVIESCIAEAQARGQVDGGFDAGSLATFILNGWEGALIDMKLSRSFEPLVVFTDTVFGRLLKGKEPVKE